MICTREALVERNMTATRVLSTRPRSVCPVHPEHALEDGPVRYRCPLGHSVPAADLDREVTR